MTPPEEPAKAPGVNVEIGPVLTCLADVEPRPVSWLWPGRIPLGRITLLVGRPGEGKSFLTTDMAARVSTGTPWPDGSDCPQGSVLMLTAEDDAADTIRPRLDAHYADVAHVHLLSAVRRVDEDGEYERLITLADVYPIEESLLKLPDCKLIVVDPIGSYLGGGTDAHRDNEVRGVLAPIAALAEKHGPAVLVVAHRRKSQGSAADDLVLGSRAFTGIARAVWHLSRDAENKTRRLLLPGKNNLGPEAGGLAFSITGKPPRISWERDPVPMHADDALAIEQAASKPGPAAKALEDAIAWLSDALADGAKPAERVKDEWKNGQAGSLATLRRAKKALGVVSFQPENPGPWYWRLPGGEEQGLKGDAHVSEDSELEHLEHLGQNTGKTAFSGPEEAQVLKFHQPEHLGQNTGKTAFSGPEEAQVLKFHQPEHLGASGGDRLRFHPRGKVTSDLPARLKAHKADLPAMLRPAASESPKPGADAQRAAQKPTGPVCRCGSTIWRDVPIHGGQSVRRECGCCGQFLEFPVWYGKTTLQHET